MVTNNNYINCMAISITIRHYNYVSLMIASILPAKYLSVVILILNTHTHTHKLTEEYTARERERAE